MSDSKRVCVGIIASAHGIRGGFKVKSFTEVPNTIFDFTDLSFEKGDAAELKANGVAGGALLATMAGVNDRNDAELLKGKKLYVTREVLPEPPVDEFYMEDMLGLDVKIADGRVVGKVIQVANYGAGDVVELKFNNGTEEMYSFIDENFPEVDIKAGTITFNAPDVIEAKK
ncbi:MAG: ribosome maturation factor RimM [Rickettsiales bacterium]|nr:ribosome maturation factor RimM [Rickettsiales bacterium]